MNRFKMFSFVVLLALSSAVLMAVPASAQGLVVYIQPYLSCTEWGPDGVCQGVLTVSWILPEDAENIIGCETLVIDDDVPVDVFCRYEDAETQFTIGGPATITRSAVSAQQAIGNVGSAVALLELSGELNGGQAQSLMFKLSKAGEMVEQGLFLPTANLVKACAHQGERISLAKGDIPPDWLPWDTMLALSASLEAVGIVTPSN